jgi:hypothetical protein
MSAGTSILPKKQAVAVPARSAAGGSLRSLLGEAAGSLGDIGTFVPIAVAMVAMAGMDAGAILVTAGMANILSGLAFGIPIAVQPMKAIGALVIAGSLTGAQAVAAGLCVGLAMLVLGSLNLVETVARRVPLAVVRALQFTVASELLLRGLQFAAGPALSAPTLGRAVLSGGAVGGAAVSLWLMRRRLEWAAIGLLAGGLAIAGWQHPELLVVPEAALWRPHLVALGRGVWEGVWMGGLPQIPLTFLNSVLAVTVLAAQLFPHRAARLEPSRLAASVGLMNLLICPFGAMPLCHGSGGLAGQYRLGARTGLSVILLGSVKLILGLFFGAAALAWMQAFPKSVLGLFLLVAGWSLASASRAWSSRHGAVTLLIMAGLYHVTGNLLLSFVSGWLVWRILGELQRNLGERRKD